MKNVLNFRAGALVLGLVLAFAGSAFRSGNENTELRTSYWFSTSPTGDIRDPLMGEPECNAEEGVICAKLYDSSDVEFDSNGEPTVIAGHENNQLEIRLKD